MTSPQSAQIPTPINHEIECVIDGLIEREGRAFTNHPADKGGPTKFGITQATLAKWRGRPVSAQEVEALAETEARVIYRELYICGPQFQRIADAILRNHVVDAGVNHGVGWAARRLQEAAGVQADGILGPISLRAINEANGPKTMHLAFCARRYAKYARIVAADPSQLVFVRGWVNRANAMMLTEADR